MSTESAQGALRLAKFALLIASLALVLGPIVGFAAGVKFSSQGVPGPAGPVGPTGVDGAVGPAGDAALEITDLQTEVDDLSSSMNDLQTTQDDQQNSIDDLTSCVNDYMDVVAKSGDGQYSYDSC